jgi:hypothetical protein
MYYTNFHGIAPLGEQSFPEHHFLGDSLTYAFPTDASLTLLADALHRFLTGAVTWEAAMGSCHAQARQWSEKTYRRTSTYAADLRPMTRADLHSRGLA